MAASNQDVFMEVGIAGTATTLSSPGHLIGGTSITVGSTTNWPTNTGVAFAIDRAELVNGVETQIAGTYTEWIGTVASATSVTNLTLSPYSPNADQNYSAGSLTRVYIPVTATVQNKMATGLANEHSQLDGTHSTTLITARTADTSPASGDSILTYDTSATALKKVTIANLWANPAYTVSTPPVTGWLSGLLPSVSSVTNNGNRSYTVAFGSSIASYLSPGMRLRLTRTVTAPTQCTDLESGSSQYYNKTSPNKCTFTDDFNAGAWVKLESYTGANQTIISRFNGTSGWELLVASTGQVYLTGYNAGGGNYRQVGSYQSLPLGRWVHVAAQLDMSAYTTTSTTCYVMFDGVEVPATLAQGGTNPTALIQAGNLEIGARNSGTNLLDGKLAQVFYSQAKVTQAQIRSEYMCQSISASATNLGSAYSFNNSIADLNTTTPNDLTAQGSAVATNSDSPFGVNSFGTPVGTYEYGIVTYLSSSTDVVVQFPEGSCPPTSGGVSAVDLSSVKVPYGMPVDASRWEIVSLYKTSITTGSVASTSTVAPFTGGQITVPCGSWNGKLEGFASLTHAGTTFLIGVYGVSTSTSSFTDPSFTQITAYTTASASENGVGIAKTSTINTTSSTAHYLVATPITANITMNFGRASNPASVLSIIPALL